MGASTCCVASATSRATLFSHSNASRSSILSSRSPDASFCNSAAASFTLRSASALPLNLLKAIFLLSSGLFAGAALYVTAVEHPARMSLGASSALQEFRPSYQRAAPVQAALASICFLNSLVVWRLTRQWPWLAGGALVGAVVPFTLTFVMPTNRLLLDAASPPKDEEALRLLAKWARLHAVRTCLSLLGFILLLVQFVRR